MAILQNGEVLIRESKASEKEALGKKGTLLLTNLRLIFETEEGLPFNKKRNTAFEVTLQQVGNVGTEGLISKALAVELRLPDGLMGNTYTIQKYKFAVPQNADWETDIRSAVQRRR